VYGQGKRKKKDTANITLHKKIANAEQHLKDVGGGYLFFQIIQIIFDIEENTTIRLFRLNLSIFKHNLPFIALSNGPPFMLQSTSKFVARLHSHNFFISAHNLTGFVKYTEQPYVSFQVELKNQSICNWRNI
jgi:hypothetical protein